jgi:type I restriction-modification system DNA methylase subunit/REP element-mobilizing transposase RayT
MPLFQSSVLKKYLSQHNPEKIHLAYQDYCNYFHNPSIQENIRNSKEEQYQEGFLRELFVSILGYTLNPNPDFNLTTEYKNIKDSKKADGAIIIENKVKAVIELKGTNTTDLGKIESQAFGYKNNQIDCTYVITSNFEKLRFYIDNAIEHIEFNLFSLNKAEFELLYLCLAFDNIKNNVAKIIKDQSVSEEDVITKKLYKDYSLFKRELFQNLLQKNPAHDPLELFQKSQKLLDRFLFIFFAEDRNLLPMNLIFRINKEWQQLQEMRIPVSLYDRYKTYFHDLNVGAKVSLPAFSQTNSTYKEEHQIFAYNGGLFKEDDLLNGLQIDDAVLFKHTENLSNYDFASEVDVNILGHIFENSLNELDEIKAQLEGAEIDKTKTKRKKDGVFYTPKYITKYIVENTVGKLCEEKKNELAIIEEEYITDKKRQKKTILTLKDKLDAYRDWLLQLTICDPACGSGAFLNQALDFLITEHQYIDELQAKLFGDALVLNDVATSILEHNLFGVDLNEESVEIAKLSLWLRTAQPNRKLNDLNSNIKCGNSLIDDPEIAGDKAFHWQQAFPTIFKEKNKKAFHITTALHDSRTSQRMIDYKVREKRNMGTNPYPVVNYLTTEEENILVNEMHEITISDRLNLLEFNVCKDHIHLVLVCDEKDVSKIVQKIKAKTARTINIHRGITTTEHAPLSEMGNEKKRGEKQNSLWTQKFGCKEITSPEQLYNTLEYVQHNRAKHELPPHPKATALVIENMLCTEEQAFAPEYKGGFDVVIGNPPYGAKLESEVQNYLNKKYIKGGSETVISFTKLSYDTLLKNNGQFGFIIPKSFSFSSNYESIRTYILNDINEIIDCKKVWKEVLLEQIIFFFQKGKKTENFKSGILKGQQIHELGQISKNTFYEFGFYLNGISEYELKIAQKVNSSKKYIKDIASNSRGGIFQNRIGTEGDTMVLGGAEIQREGIIGIKGYINKSTILEDKKCFISENSLLVQNLVAHIENPTEHIKITACLPLNKNYVIVDTINQITFQKEYNANVFWCLFNSKLINWYSYRFIFAKAIRTMHFDNSITNRIPIPDKISQKPFIEKADMMLSLNKAFQEVVSKFQRTLQRKFFTTKAMEHAPLPRNLQEWYRLSFTEFIKDLTKNKVKLSLLEETEWEDFFEQERKKAQELKAQIDATDKAIDQMVYELYGLSEEEIGVVEGR